MLHSRGILHGDVKPSNILLDASSGLIEGGVARLDKIKLCDFGNARRSRDARYYRITGDVSLVPWSCVSGTLGYVAPEILLKKSYSTPADVWSVGVLLYELLGGFQPFQPYATCLNTSVCFPPPWGVEISAEAQHLVASMLELDPLKRITALAACAHPFFTLSL